MEKMNLLDANGATIEVDVIRYFYMNDNAYLLYSMDEVDEQNYIKLYAVKTLGATSQPITDDNEWATVKDMIKVIIRGNKNGNLDINDLDFSIIETPLVTETKVFKLSKQLSEMLGANKKDFSAPEMTEEKVEEQVVTEEIPSFENTLDETEVTPALEPEVEETETDLPSFEEITTTEEAPADLPSFEEVPAEETNELTEGVSELNPEVNSWGLPTDEDVEEEEAKEEEVEEESTEETEVNSWEEPELKEETTEEVTNSWEVPEAPEMEEAEETEEVETETEETTNEEINEWEMEKTEEEETEVEETPEESEEKEWSIPATEELPALEEETETEEEEIEAPAEVEAESMEEETTEEDSSEYKVLYEEEKMKVAELEEELTELRNRIEAIKSML